MWTRLRTASRGCASCWTRRRLDEDARLEIDAHLDLLAERYLRQGMSPDEAYMAARRQFGNAALMRQDIHDMNSIGWIEQAAQDLRYACPAAAPQPRVCRRGRGHARPGHRRHDRRVQRRPGGAAGAAARTKQPGQLVRFYQQEPGKPDTRDVLAGTHFTFLRDHAASFEDVAALAHYSETGLDLVTGGRAERLRVLRVSSGYFSALRSPPGSAVTSTATTRRARAASCSATRRGERTSAAIRRSSAPRFG